MTYLLWGAMVIYILSTENKASVSFLLKMSDSISVAVVVMSCAEVGSFKNNFPAMKFWCKVIPFLYTREDSNLFSSLIKNSFQSGDVLMLL